jgi:hypothetical protein
MKPAAKRVERPEGLVPPARPRLVRPLPGVSLARLIAPQGEGWLVRLGAEEQLASVDPSVDPLLLLEAQASGARVLLEMSALGAMVVGVVQTSRALRIDRTGQVEVQVERLSVQARTEVVLKTFAASLQLKAGEVEIRGVRTLIRARELAKVLARMISLN